MKINALGIQAYQQLQGQKRTPLQQDPEAEKSARSEERMSIPAQPGNESSTIAVKPAQGSYAQFLSPEERQALDLLFGRYQGSNSATSGSDASQQPEQARVGAVIDIKV